MNMGLVLNRAVDRTPDTVGIVDPIADVQYTYQTLYDRSIAVAAVLKSRGIGEGDRVATAMRNRVELVTLYCATQLLGAVFVPYNFRVSAEELTHLVENSTPDILFFSSEVADAVADGEWNTNPSLVSIDADSESSERYEAFLEASGPDSFEPTFVDPDKTSVILHTGGTSGKPKGVPRTHRNTYAAATAHALQNSWSQGESTLGLMSLSHTMGIHALASILVLGGKWVAQREFSATDTVDLIESEEITSLYLVPTVYHDLLRSDAANQADLSSVQHVAYAGSNMNPSIVREIESQFNPQTFVNHYGSTEVYTHAVCSWVSEKPNCVGRAGINTAVRVVEPSDFGQLDPNDTVDRNDLGEIIVDTSSPEAFDGYLSETTDDRSLTDGWFFTGDLGYRDEDGDLYFVGRVDDMIISGGENIYPVEVESVLERHDLVTEAAVVGRPSERWNQTVAAFVTLAADPSGTDFETAATTLDDHCRESEELADFKRPRRYCFIDEFTKSNVGKILRKELQKRDLNIDVHGEIDV
ncbi:long-chain fatty acid--CoA ligase (plasmid) [Natrinema versiforme]|uniref:Long-chain fatty acid--CoA ligase n=2 Tax=Natrinema versiforme TaxID=88724 RepID=A0A4V1G093_9EURY|nr:long-chain fatty acid--CoA ligase [Natrinema versiforme]